MSILIIIFTTIIGANDSTNVHFLPSIELNNHLHSDSENNVPFIFEGLPINPSFIQIVNVGNRKMISLPILINESNLKSDIDSKLFNPRYWREIDNAIEFGRPSLWFLPVGSKTIYSIVIDPRSENDIGIGLVFVKNLGNDIYEVFMTDFNGVYLFAAVGIFKRLDEEYGVGYIEPSNSELQLVTQNKYQPIWKIEPKDFFLFGQ